MLDKSYQRRVVTRKLLELQSDYPFITFTLVDYVLQVDLYPSWPGEMGEELSAEQDLEYKKSLLEHARKVYMSKPKWFFEAAETRAKLELENDEKSPPSVDFAGFEKKNYLPDGYLERRVSPPGSGKRPIRSTPPPKGYIRLTITVPAGLHSLLKSRALEKQTTIKSVMDDIFEKIVGGFRPNLTRLFEHIEKTYNGQANSKRLSVNVPAEKHFRLKENAERDSLTLNKLIVQALILELYDLEYLREDGPVSEMAPKDVSNPPVAVTAKPLSSVSKLAFDECDDDEELTPRPRM